MACTIPTSIDAGLTFDSLVTLTAYPAPDWAVNLLLRGPASINLALTPDGSGHRLHVDAATTGAWAAGTYAYSLRATRDGEIYQVDNGYLVVRPNMATLPDGTDVRSQARRTLEAIEAVIERRASVDQERYVINNRELWRTPIADLLKLRDNYRAEVMREERAACGRSPWGPAVKVRF